MKEKAFEKKVRQYLDDIGAWHVKFWGGAFSKKGVPDVLACINGFFVAIELKSETGKPSELQAVQVWKINNSGGIACVLYPAGMARFKKICEELMLCNSHTQKLKRLKTALTDSSCDIYPKSKYLKILKQQTRSE